jgi:hypothetical protein
MNKPPANFLNYFVRIALNLFVPDPVSRICDVVLVRRTIDLKRWEFGTGREWGGDEKGEVSLRVTRDPRWTGLHHAKGGFPSK